VGGSARVTTLLVTHPSCLEHRTGPHHPERPERLKAVLEALSAPEFAGLLRAEAPRASLDQLTRVHPREYVLRTLGAVPEEGLVEIGEDTVLSPGSGEAALRAAGAVVHAVEEVAGGRASNAFCAVRPPGHHAEPAKAMGFCLFNNVLVGARHAQTLPGIARVAVVDFDLHHGNGTQAVAEGDDTLFYASTHEYPQYPGTGSSRETGLGNVVNVPLFRGTDGAGFRHAVSERILPALSEFVPGLLVVSAGFDAHKADPMGDLELSVEDFAWATAQLRSFASAYCSGRIVSVLEGGYDLEALAASAAAHVRELMKG
jgi:acetoin utilization deacetylase AcuC-like enzyme